MRKIIQPCGFHCIKINNLGVSFGEQTVLEDVNMHIHCGSFNVIIGQNGAGKSTLIKAILGEIPHTGTIEFKDTKDGHMAKLKIGYVPQNPARQHRAFPISVREVVSLGRLSGGSMFQHYTHEDKAAVDDIIERFSLKELAHRKIGELSGGQQQRVYLARAMVRSPQLLLLDEPSMGLAPLLVKEIFNIIKEINESGTTVLLVEQNANMALSIADKAYVLETGRIALAGTAQELASSEAVRKAYLGG